MRKPDHETKDALPRVLTDAEVETLSVAKLRKLLKEGHAVIDRAETERQIAEELGPPRGKQPALQIPQRRPTIH